MEYEDTNILRTQYVDDLVEQRDDLENVLRKQDVDVEEGEGFETMIPKTELIEGAPVLPHYCFAKGLVETINNIVPGINFASQKNFYGCFAEISDTSKYDSSLKDYIVTHVDLTSVNTINGENFEAMVAGTYDFKLGKYFLLNNAKSLKRFAAGGIASGTRYTGERCSRDLSQLPVQKASNVTDLSFFCATGDNRVNMSPDLFKFIKDFFSKVTFDNPEVDMSSIFYGLDLGSSTKTFTDDEIVEMQEAIKTLAKAVVHPSKYDRIFYDTNEEAVMLFAPLLNYNDVKSMNEFAYRCDGGKRYAHIHNNVLDLSKAVFNKLEKLYYFSYDSFDNTGYQYTFLMGTCPNETLKDISSGFNGSRSIVTLDMSGWNFGGVELLSSAFSGLQGVVNFKFGYNLGKAYHIYKSNNNSNATLTLSSCNNLSYESLIDIIGKLYDLNITYDVANGGKLYTQKLVIGTTNKAKLTPEEIAIATNKGWTVS